MTAEIETPLCQMSPSTIDRLLHAWRRLGGRRPFSTIKPSSLLKSSIPIRTFADWQEDRPGFLEVSLKQRNPTAAQHKGLGKALLREAERIAGEEFQAQGR